MKLSIKNIGAIKSAEIKLDGITVVAGYNNVGKSTIGKTLYATFNSLNNIGQRVDELRRDEFITQFRVNLDEVIDIQKGRGNSYYRFTNYQRLIQRDRVARLISEGVINNFAINDDELSAKNIDEILNSINIKISDEQRIDLIDKIKSSIKDISQISDKNLENEVIERYFKKVFKNQVTRIGYSESCVSMDIQGSEVKIKFACDECIDNNRAFEIQHKAFYIDDPCILDELNPWGISTNDIHSDLIEMLTSDDAIGIFESIYAKEKLEKIKSILNETVCGTVITKNGEKFLKENKTNYEIALSNLSTGVKAFVIFQLLFEKGVLKNKDVIILDEPEIHLHPKWQLLYAQFLVILQKEFDMTIFITTHSPDFLQAIDLYAKKYGISDSCNFYIGKNESDDHIFSDVTKNLSSIYEQLYTPSMELDELRYELENKENE